MIRPVISTAAVAALGCLAQPAPAASKQLGSVQFETSCKPAAQKLFNQGMIYQHSFWYRASQRTFEDVLKADPKCGMAYWGIAMSLLTTRMLHRRRRTCRSALMRSRKARR